MKTAVSFHKISCNSTFFSTPFPLKNRSTVAICENGEWKSVEHLQNCFCVHKKSQSFGDSHLMWLQVLCLLQFPAWPFLFEGECSTVNLQPHQMWVTKWLWIICGSKNWFSADFLILRSIKSNISVRSIFKSKRMDIESFFAAQKGNWDAILLIFVLLHFVLMS